MGILDSLAERLTPRYGELWIPKGEESKSYLKEFISRTLFEARILTGELDPCLYEQF